RSRVSVFSLRTSADSSCPFLSRSSLSLVSSACSPSSFFCMAAFSRSSASRAATPAAERGTTRWGAVKAMRVAPVVAGAGACAPAGNGDHQTPRDQAATRARPGSNPFRTTCMSPTSFVSKPSLEWSAHRELKLPEALVLTAVELDAVVDPERPERRSPPQAEPRIVPEIADVELGAERRVRPVHLPDVHKGRRPDSEEQRHRVFQVAQEQDGAAHPGSRVVDRRDLTRLESPQRIGTAQIETLEQRHRIRRPAYHVAALEARAEHGSEPDVVEGG